MSQSSQPSSTSSSADALNRAAAARQADPAAYAAALHETKRSKQMSNSDFVKAVMQTLEAKQIRSPAGREGSIKADDKAKLAAKATARAEKDSVKPGVNSVSTSTSRPDGAAKQANLSAATDSASKDKPAPCIAEELDLGPPGPAPWEDAQIIGPLLESGEEREAFFVESLVRREYEMFERLHCAVESRRALDAVREFRGARDLCRSLIKTAENLVQHRYGGVQTIAVLDLGGSRIGLAAKIQAMRGPQKDTPEARLVDRVHHVERVLDEAATCFGQKAGGQLNLIRRHETLGVPFKWENDAEHWDKLRSEALQLMNALSVLVNTLERGHRQVFVKKQERLRTDCERITDRELQCDAESDGEDGKLRPRQPVAN